MADVSGEHGWTGPRGAPVRLSATLSDALSGAGSPLLFGLRLWASVCLALYVAFWLELDNAYKTVFMLAVARASEICIGIVCAGVVLASTDLGGARRRLTALFAAMIAEIMTGFTSTLALAGPDLPDTQPVRRELVRRASALDPLVDQAVGESSELRSHSPVLQTAVDGLFAALAGWRVVAVRLSRLPDDDARHEARAVLEIIRQVLWPGLEHGAPMPRIADPVRVRRIFEERCRCCARRRPARRR